MASSPDREFAEHCCELLAAAGPCTARRMFGGWGISTGGLNIALIAWDRLYLKANEETRARFLEAGCQPFRYEARGRAMQLDYYTAPEQAMDAPQPMAPWARLALEAALKARAAPARRPRKTRPAGASPVKPAASRSSAPAAPRKARRSSDAG